ncbi:hypothetical protein BGZ54_000926 [Gamsiella multidivaricata]|nr:hypothetical protein BGZ54_000926 [Gamsiella multidivaricata]
MDRLSEALSTEQGPRREGTDSGRMDQDSSNSNVTSMKRSTLSNMNNATTVSCSIPIPNEPPNQKISRKQSSILEAAIGTFPEFQVHLEEPRHSNEKANKNKVSTNNMKLDYSNQCRGESRETPARRKPSGSAVDNVDPELHVLKRRLRVQPSQMENVEKISETSTNSPLISSVTAVSGKTTAPTVATSRTPKRKKSTELENASRPTLISKDRSPSSSLTLTGPKMDSSKRRKPKRSSSEITTTESALPSQDITSSAAFEANMFDIEQYVEQDLQGYNQLSY